MPEGLHGVEQPGIRRDCQFRPIVACDTDEAHLARGLEQPESLQRLLDRPRQRHFIRLVNLDEIHIVSLQACQARLHRRDRGRPIVAQAGREMTDLGRQDHFGPAAAVGQRAADALLALPQAVEWRRINESDPQIYRGLNRPQRLRFVHDRSVAPADTAPPRPNVETVSPVRPKVV